VDTSLKTCLASRNFGSMCLGARKPWQTTKISAETLLPVSYYSQITIVHNEEKRGGDQE